MTHTPRLPLIAGLPWPSRPGCSSPSRAGSTAPSGRRLGDGIAAAVVSFSTGLVLMTADFAGAAARAGPGWRGSCRPCANGSFRPIYVLAGCIGALFVFAQSFTVGTARRGPLHRGRRDGADPQRAAGGPDGDRPGGEETHHRHPGRSAVC